MAYEELAEGVLDYFPYRIGRSRLLFRGPKRKLTLPYVAVLGGSETYGKFVARPYPAQLEDQLGLPVLNLGCMHAGVSVFVDDDAVLSACSGADVTVIQVMGAANMSNRLYSVHPRRNDRFLRASLGLRNLYPGVDFTEFNFTRHLLSALEDASSEAFGQVRTELKDAWTNRMRALIGKITGQVVLMWMSTRRPEEADDLAGGTDPLFVDRAMLEDLRDDVSDIVEVVASNDARAEGLESKVFAQMDAPAASEVPGTLFHAEAATVLAAALAPHLERERRDPAGTAPPQFRSSRVRAFQ